MRRVKVVFKEKQHTPVTFEAQDLTWRIHGVSVTIGIPYYDEVEAGHEIEKLEVLGYFNLADILYIVKDDCICTAFDK